MSSSNDPYRHYPHLRGKIADPLTSRYREVDIDAVDHHLKANGVTGKWRRSDAEREQSRLDTLRDYMESDVWLFGYGSLIWDPGICFDEVRIGTLRGYHRHFCMRSELGRGSPENPGLMVALDRGGECQSIAFRIPNHILHEETTRIWKREMLRHSYWARFVSVQTEEGEIQALTFIVDPGIENYMGNLSLDEAAQYVAGGVGMYGTSLEYVENLVNHLDAFGIQDESVHALFERARELAAHGPASPTKDQQ